MSKHKKKDPKRLSEALRANLRKRKALMRARQQSQDKHQQTDLVQTSNEQYLTQNNQKI